MTYRGECFCGTVKVEAQGEPEAMGYCHCRSCRSWSGSPVAAFTLWKPENVKVTAGEDALGAYSGSETACRRYCKRCGGSVMIESPPNNIVNIFSATIPDLKFQPGVHLHYAEAVLPMQDGLPKFKDFPAIFGGTDEMIAEAGS